MDHEDKPILQGEALRLALAQASAEIALQSVCALAELGLLMPHRSHQIEETVRRMADLCRQAGGQIAETVFDKAANEIARLRDELPPPTA